MDSTVMISPFFQNVYLLIINLSVLIGLVNAWTVWQRRKLPGATALVACVLVCVLISVSFLGISTTELPIVAFWWVRLKFLAVSILPGTFFLFCVEFTGHKSWIKASLVFALLIVPLFTQLALWADPTIGLFFRNWTLVRLDYISIERQQFAGAFWIYSIYSTVLFGTSLALLVRDLHWLGSLRRTQLWAIVLSVGAAVVFVWLSTALPSVVPLSLTPLGVLIAATTFTWLLFSQGLFDVIPIAYDTVLGGIRDAVLIFDSHDHLVRINHQAEIVLKQSNRDVLGKSIGDLPFGNSLLDLADSQPFELNYNNEVYQVDISSLQTEKHQPVGKLVVLRDTTKRKQMEQELIASEEKFRSFFEQSSDGVVIINDSGKIIEWNSSFEQLTGFKRDDVLGQFLWDIQFRLAPPGTVTPELYESVKTQTLNAARTDQSPLFNRTLEAEFYLADGLIKHVQQHIFPIQTGTGYRIGSITRDITERKQAQERDFELALEKERVRLLSRFIRTASHEFRTPLTVISLNAFNMIRQPDAEKRQSRAQIITDQVSRITKLLDILLKMSELESQKELLLAQESIEALLNFACQNLAKKYGSTPVVRKEIQLNLPPVIVNSAYLLDAFEQLLDNAYRFSPVDGTITVSAQMGSYPKNADGTPALENNSQTVPMVVAESQHIYVKVHNTGSIIPEADLPHIFETFWREDHAHTTPGLGLGLAMARKIIELSGGTIQVESTERTGTIFSIILPLSPSRL